MAIYTSITDLIGGTPLLELKNYEAENKLEAKILGKLEYFNPAGSVKDRIAYAMITDDQQARHIALRQAQHRHQGRLHQPPRH